MKFAQNRNEVDEKLLSDKNRFYEKMYWHRLFIIIFLRRLANLLHFSRKKKHFLSKWVQWKLHHYPVNLRNLLVSLYLTPLSTVFEKVCGETFDLHFLIFSVSSKNLPKSSVFRLMGGTGCEKLPWISATPIFFYRKKLF